MDNIVSAIYGANNTYISVMSLLNQTEIVVSNDTFGDPISGVAKQLIIIWKNGDVNVFEENTSINFNNLRPMKIYIGYQGYSQGGFGDFIRSAFSLYVYCVKNNIGYDIYIPTNPIKKCIECIRTKINIKEIMLTCFQTNKTKIISELDTLRKSNSDIIVYSNILFINKSDLVEYRNDFIKNIIRTQIVETRIAEIRDMIKNNRWVCLHIRCGDKHISSGGHCINHQTMSLDDMTIYTQISQCIEFLKKFDVPICVISDSDKFKDILSKKFPVVIFNTVINHVAIPHTGSDDGIVDTISEFFILSESKANIMFKYSGFVLWSSSLYSVPLYEYSDGNIIPYDYAQIESII